MRDLHVCCFARRRGLLAAMLSHVLHAGAVAFLSLVTRGDIAPNMVTARSGDVISNLYL